MSSARQNTHDVLTEADHVRIAARYPHRRSRPMVTAVAVVAVSALALWGVWAGLGHSRTGVHGELFSYEVLADDQVKVHVDVHRSDPARAAVCTIQAQAPSGETVGEVDLAVAPALEEDVRLQATIKTYLRAHTAFVTRCRLS